MAKLVRAGHEKQLNKINKKESSDDSGLPGDSDSAGIWPQNRSHRTFL